MMSDNIVSLSDGAERLFKRGNRAVYSGDYPQAVYCYKQAVEAGDKPEYVLELLSVLNQIAYFDQTVRYAVDALQKPMTDIQRAIVHFYMGEAYYCMGMNVQAEQAFNTCLQLDKNNAFAPDITAYLTEINKDEGEGEYPAQLQQARLEAAQGNTQNALDICNAYLVANPDDADALEIAAALYAGCEMYDEALHAVNAVLRRNPQNVQVLVIGMGCAEITGSNTLCRRYEKLLTDIREAPEQGMELLTRYFSGAQKDALARKVFGNIYNANPFDKEAIYALAVAYYNTGERDAALKMLQRLENLEGKPAFAALVRQHIASACPPKLYYIMEPDREQVDILCTNLFNMADGLSGQSDDAYCRRLADCIELGIRYANPMHFNAFLQQLPLDDIRIRRLLYRTLCDVTIEPDKKLRLAAVFESLGDKNIMINITGEPVEYDSTKAKSTSYRLMLHQRVNNGYTLQQIQDAVAFCFTKGLENILIADSTEQSVAVELAAQILADKTPDYKELAEYYGVSYEYILDTADKLLR